MTNPLSPREGEVLEMLAAVRWATPGQVLRWIWGGASSSQGYAVLERLANRRLIRLMRPDWGRGAATSHIVWLAPMGYVALGLPRRSVEMLSDGRLRHTLQATEMLLQRRAEGWVWLPTHLIATWVAGHVARLNLAIQTPPGGGVPAFTHWQTTTRPPLVRERNALTRMLTICQSLQCDMLWDPRGLTCRAVVSVTSPSVVKARLSRATVHCLYQVGTVDLEVVTVRDDVWRRLTGWLRYMHPRSRARFALHEVPRTF